MTGTATRFVSSLLAALTACAVAGAQDGPARRSFDLRETSLRSGPRLADAMVRGVGDLSRRGRRRRRFHGQMRPVRSRGCARDDAERRDPDVGQDRTADRADEPAGCAPAGCRFRLRERHGSADGRGDRRGERQRGLRAGCGRRAGEALVPAERVRLLRVAPHPSGNVCDGSSRGRIPAVQGHHNGGWRRDVAPGHHPRSRRDTHAGSHGGGTENRAHARGGVCARDVPARGADRPEPVPARRRQDLQPHPFRRRPYDIQRRRPE